jgi:molybdopterin-guanine dinucleotide biosynthesis protein A
MYQGETLAVRAARVLSEVCDPVIEVGPGVSGLRVVREDPPGAGPLAALLAGVDALNAEGAVVLLACDLPFVDGALLSRIADRHGAHSVIPLVDERGQFACARWSAVAIAHARAGNGRALQDLLAGDEEYVSADMLGAAADQFGDIDAPGDLDSLNS